ncbi:MAG: FAD-dependent monooxygenase [Acidobacteria bacterium]|nr:MAG: FAD-dependent monooxygenase [Acidobacteriota bacterium]
MIMLPVAIVGGGPVGLFLAGCLAHLGVDCRVLEQRSGVAVHSRSIGIHAVSMDLFRRLGLSAEFLARGIQVKRGLALDRRGRLGELNLSASLSAFPFVLILPQDQTERIFQEHLLSIGAAIVSRGTKFIGLRSKPGYVEIDCQDSDGRQSLVEAQFVVACDGKRSQVRQGARIPFLGSSYPDYFTMGDFDDNTAFGPDAAIFLPSQGLIESFPLPGARRRWVVRLEEPVPSPEVPPARSEIESVLKRRIGHDLRGCKNYMLSRFQAERYLAPVLFNGRIVLAGDAAHVVSPIGGQGLNLGWLGAWRLAGQLSNVIRSGVDHPKAFSAYSLQQRGAARRAARRAEMNMRLGRRRRHVSLRNALVRVMLHSPIDRLTARLFTMQGLYSWPV